jgi:hypothetical protein
MNPHHKTSRVAAMLSVAPSNAEINIDGKIYPKRQNNSRNFALQRRIAPIPASSAGIRTDQFPSDRHQLYPFCLFL